MDAEKEPQRDIQSGNPTINNESDTFLEQYRAQMRRIYTKEVIINGAIMIPIGAYAVKAFAQGDWLTGAFASAATGLSGTIAAIAEKRRRSTG